jgi:hypothetical protein
VCYGLQLASTASLTFAMTVGGKTYSSCQKHEFLSLYDLLSNGRLCFVYNRFQTLTTEGTRESTVIPRLTSDPANEFSANEDFSLFFGLG